jgi:16S rRNA (guanine966-N2)-methyltransferase
MRIVAGRLRGRSLAVPDGGATRPTGDRARQALFNILENGAFAAAGSPLVGVRVLDAFAGTGALGIEALSRGAAHASFFEQDRAAIACLQRNIARLGLGDAATIVSHDATRPPPAHEACGLVFLDPPYQRGLIAPALVALQAAGWIEPGGLVVAELGKAETFVPPEGFSTLDRRYYGAAQLLFLRAPSPNVTRSR